MHTSPSQSAPTILVLKTWVGLWPWKKSGPKYGPEKSRLQKTGSLLFKKRRGSLSLFFAPCFLQPIFWTWFFSGSQTDQCFQNKNSGCRLTGQWCDNAPLAECIYSSLHKRGITFCYQKLFTKWVGGPENTVCCSTNNPGSINVNKILFTLFLFWPCLMQWLKEHLW